MAEWKVGEEVAIGFRGFNGVRYDRYDKVAKVYATGNVILEGEAKQQWRPSGETATRAGSSAYSKQFARLLTPELEAEIDKDKRVLEARRRIDQEADRLMKIARSGDADEILAAERTLPPYKEPL